MLTFDVYAHQSLGFQAVKRGFSWPAFIFGMFWALYKRLWLVAAVYLLISLLFAMNNRETQAGGLATIDNWIGFGISLFVGAAGNGWWRQALLEQGYSHVRAVVAASPKAAIERLYGEQGGATC